ncbi:MAG TPA: DoxX family protein [Bacteroidia bacterium]|nr:DoxX family protein [Bacteroidia bacterium]
MIRKTLFWLMPALYILAGIYHFINPEFYNGLMPQWLPYHLPLIYLSGVVEFLLGVLLIPKQTRIISAWLIIAMLTVFFFVIHIPMTIIFYQNHNPRLWIAIVRLPIQFYLIWWAMKYTKNRLQKIQTEQIPKPNP